MPRTCPELSCFGPFLSVSFSTIQIPRSFANMDAGLTRPAGFTFLNLPTEVRLMGTIFYWSSPRATSGDKTTSVNGHVARQILCPVSRSVPAGCERSYTVPLFFQSVSVHLVHPMHRIPQRLKLPECKNDSEHLLPRLPC